MAVKTELINIIITGDGLTYYTEVVSEALRLTGAKVYTTPVHSLVVTFDILQSKPMTDIPRISLKTVLQPLILLLCSYNSPLFLKLAHRRLC